MRLMRSISPACLYVVLHAPYGSLCQRQGLTRDHAGGLDAGFEGKYKLRRTVPAQHRHNLGVQPLCWFQRRFEPHHDRGAEPGQNELLREKSIIKVMGNPKHFSIIERWIASALSYPFDVAG